MTTTLALSGIGSKILWDYEEVLAWANNENQAQFNYNTSLANGQGASQADQLYVAQSTLAASGTLALNLGALTDMFGNVLNVKRLKAIYLENTAATASSAIQLQGAGVQNPTAAPVLTPSTSGGSLGTGNYTVGYTFTSSAGETQLSPTAVGNITSGTTGSIAVGAITLPAGVTGLNIYVSFAAGGTAIGLKQSQANGNAYTITSAPATSVAPPPQANTCLQGPASLPAFLTPVRNGGNLFVCAPDATGYAVNSPNNLMQLANLDGTNVATYRLVLVGASA